LAVSVAEWWSNYFEAQ